MTLVPSGPPSGPSAGPPAETPGGPPPAGLPPESGTPKRIRLARGIAIAADVVQLLLIPFFAGGVLSPFNDMLDVAVALVMIWLVGWHFAFLPTFIAELVPGLDLIPSWTAAVWFVTRGRSDTRRAP